jgi:hypothetical protein
MSVSNNTIDDSNGVYAFDSSLSKAIKFWFILFSEILSMPCYIVLIYYYLAHKTMRQPLYNHAIIASLFVDLAIISIDLSCHLGFLRLGYIVPSIPAVCLIWQLVDYGFWYGDLFLKSWAAIERHILIFHSNLINTARKRLFIHYFPLTFVILYTPIIYIYLIFFYPAEHIYDYTVLLCGGPYYYNGIPGWLIWYESLFHYVIPIFVLIIFSNALFIRVIWQKRRLRVAHGWRHYRKMTIQLVFVSIIYLFDLPYIIVTIVRWSGYPDFGTDVQGPYFYYVNYIPIILFPFAVLGTLPKLTQKICFWKNKQQDRITVIPNMPVKS